MRQNQVLGQLLPLAALLVFGCVAGTEKHEASAPPRWTSRAIPEARGEVKEIGGRRVQVRYNEEPFSTFTTNYERWPTYAYNDARSFPQPTRGEKPPVSRCTISPSSL